MPRVLSTKMLSESQKNLILHSGWSLVQYNAIQTLQLPNISYLKNATFEHAIVTSQTTVSILVENQVKLKTVFCIGKKTASKVSELGFQVIETASYGEDLAEIIISKYAHLHFDFFCGKSRNEALPNSLKQHQINFTEHPIYETLPNPKRFSSTFDAILFFSPSGVESYYAPNSFQNERMICIGKTTASMAKQIADKIEVATNTSIESVIVKLVNSRS